MEALNLEECRVLGSLIEKEATVPDAYPLSAKALVAACNQSTNRDPVVAYDEATVTATLASLKERRLVRFVHPSHGERVTKYRHVAHETLGLAPDELPVVALLLLRGPQTPGELRARTDRYPDAGDVGQALAALARRDDPLVTELPRASGQKEARWAHLLAGEPDPVPAAAPSEPGGAPASPPPGRPAPGHHRLDELEAEVAELRGLVEHLYTVLDETPPR